MSFICSCMHTGCSIGSARVTSTVPNISTDINHVNCDYSHSDVDITTDTDIRVSARSEADDNNM